MPYPPKPPTPQIVGAILKRAGLNRAEPCGPGRDDHTEGYRVRKCPWDSSLVQVVWWADTRSIDPGANRRRRDGQLQRCKDAVLSDALYRSRLRAWIVDEQVLVGARKSPETSEEKQP